jgi:methylmalonyl-CoA mutase
MARRSTSAPGREDDAAFRLRHRVRVVTAASLFDGHDAAIHIMRRILQAEGAEVIHLGHNRSVQEVVDAAIQEDAQAVAVSSYQGGHVEYFTYMVDLLRKRGCGHIRVYGGGGGVIAPDEIALLHKRGVARIFSPEDGRAMGLEGMIRHMLAECDHPPGPPLASLPEATGPDSAAALARGLSTLEWDHGDGADSAAEAKTKAGAGAGKAASSLRKDVSSRLLRVTPCPVLGVTGTGGAGKSSLVDELLLRFLAAFPGKRIAVLCVDPSRRRTGGALLGDRLRINAASRSDRIFFRSMATRRAHAATSASVRDSLDLLRSAGFDLVILETAGIGQSDSEVAELADLSLYVMTPEFGAPSQLEKIDMLDYADYVALNKFDKAGAEDALKEVRKACQRNRKAFDRPLAEMPVYPTCAHRFQDAGTNALFNALVEALGALDGRAFGGATASREAARASRAPRKPAPEPSRKNAPRRAGVPEPTSPAGAWSCDPLPSGPPDRQGLIPRERAGYLREIAEAVLGYHSETEDQTARLAAADHCYHALLELGDRPPGKAEPYPSEALAEAAVAYRRSRAAAGSSVPGTNPAILDLRRRYNALLAQVDPTLLEEVRGFEARRESYRAPTHVYRVRDREIRVENHTVSQSGLGIPKVCLPDTASWAEQAAFLRSENAPGCFPFTAGVFPFKRDGEDPTRMFAGEGIAERTNARFHYVSRGQKAVRLSTAFDSVTLYGADPDPRPDILGKVGNSGVSVCCLDDAKRLYSGFDLCASSTSVSMTINGPAPILLAYFFNAAVDAACERRLKADGRWGKIRARIARWFKDRGSERPAYRTPRLPEGHDGSGLGFLGLPADLVMERDEYLAIRAGVLETVRGTVQADILKEDQAQNTCIFSTGFSLRLMGDVQDYFLRNRIRNFYSVSISGYHIAEAGANPITQLALTLANGFTYVEYYRARGMDISAFAPNLSFFFSNGLDPEYAVLGRVARRIWAVAMKRLYGADGRSQKLKYHIQTSGRSLHAREIDFNDIRTTLQALLAMADNCNSLHTNAYDEAITTPTEGSVRRAMAIQLILGRELGLLKNENPFQGSYVLEVLTRKVEEEVLRIFGELDARGGVLGAMEGGYQRGRIQEESLLYERRKQSGEIPIVGVNTFLGTDPVPGSPELIRSTTEEKRFQVAQVREMAARFPEEGRAALDGLRHAAVQGGNLFESLMEAAKYCTLGALSGTLYEVGGAYRRST